MKKILALVLALTLALSAVSCSAQPQGSTEESTTQEATDSTASTTDAPQGDMDPYGKYDEPVTITSVRAVGADWTYPTEGDDIHNNPFTRYLKDELNIIVEYEWTVDRTQYDTKVATMLASNSMPDFFFADSAVFTKLVNENNVMDITDVYANYASDYLKAEDASFVQAYESAFRDGKQYGITRLGWGVVSSTNILWLREDWLSNSGSDAPQTMDDFIELAKTFMSNNPDTYGLAVDKTLTGAANSLTPIMNAYGAFSGQWNKDESGQIVYSSIQPEMKDALLALQEMYADGIISQEFAVKDYNKTSEDIIAGKVGMMFGAQWMGFYPFQDVLKNDPEGLWKPYSVPSIDGEQVTLQGGWPAEGYYVINNSCENPEAVIKAMNLFHRSDLTGEFSELYSEGLHWDIYPITQTMPSSGHDAPAQLTEAYETRETGHVTHKYVDWYNEGLKWLDEGDPNGYGRYIQMGEEGSYNLIYTYINNDKVLLSEMQGAAPEGYAAIKSTLDKLEIDTFTEIIMGASIDKFDEFVDTWYKLGGETATAEINDMYNV